MEWQDSLILRSLIRSDEAKAIAEMLHIKNIHISEKMPDCLDTVLTYACRYGSVETVKLCIDNGVNVDVDRDKQGYSPLIIAIRYEYSDIVNILCLAGAEVNSFPIGDRSTLHWALCCPTSASTALRTVEILCQYGLEIGITSVDQIAHAIDLIEHSSKILKFLSSCGFMGCAEVRTNTLFKTCIYRIRKSLISPGKPNLLFSVQRLMLPDRVKSDVIFGLDLKYNKKQ